MPSEHRQYQDQTRLLKRTGAMGPFAEVLAETIMALASIWSRASRAPWDSGEQVSEGTTRSCLPSHTGAGHLQLQERRLHFSRPAGTAMKPLKRIRR